MRKEKTENPNIRIGERQTIEELTGGRIRKWHGDHPYHAGIGEPEPVPDVAKTPGLTRDEAIDKAAEVADESYSQGIHSRNRDDLYR